MSFMYPQLLWLLPLVAAPVIIHLLNRLRYKTVSWAAVRFLTKTTSRMMRRSKLMQLLLLACRCALVALIVLLIATPVADAFASVFGRSAAGERFWVVDNSLSMDAISAGQSSLDRARDLCRRLTDKMPVGREAIGSISRAWRSPYTYPVKDRDALPPFLDDLRLHYTPADIPHAIETILQHRQPGRPPAIYLLTDMVAHSWQPDSHARWADLAAALDEADARVVVVDVHNQDEFNAGVRDLRVTPSVVLAGDSCRIEATVAHFGDVPPAWSAALLVNGRKSVAAEPVAGENGALLVFTIPSLPAGTHRLTIQLPPDQVAADNQFHLRLVVGEKARAAALGEPDFFLNAVFAANPAVEIIGLPTDAELTTVDESCIFAGRPDIAPEALLALKNAVIAGATLIATGDFLLEHGAAFGLPNPTRISLPAPVGAHLTDEGDALFPDLRLPDLDEVRIGEIIGFDVPDDLAVMIETEDGAPALAARVVGRGKLIALAVPAGLDASNLPLKLAWPVLVQTLVEQYTESPNARPWVASPGEIPLRPLDNRLITATGATNALTAPTDSAGRRTMIVPPDWSPGFYTISGPQGDDRVVAVNYAADSLERERIDSGRVRDLVGSGRTTIVRAAAGDVAAQSRTATQADISWIAGVICLALIVGEAILLTRARAS